MQGSGFRVFLPGSRRSWKFNLDLPIALFGILDPNYTRGGCFCLNLFVICFLLNANKGLLWSSYHRGLLLFHWNIHFFLRARWNNSFYWNSTLFLIIIRNSGLFLNSRSPDGVSSIKANSCPRGSCYRGPPPFPCRLFYPQTGFQHSNMLPEFGYSAQQPLLLLS